MNYNEIVSMWEKGREQWRDYEHSVGQVAAKIYSFIWKKLEIKTDNQEKYLKLVPPDEKDDDKLRNTSWAPFACVKLQDNGWSTVGLLLLIEKDERTWPKNQYKFFIHIKYKDDNWTIKIADDGEQYSISKDLKDKELLTIWEEFIELIKYQTIDSLAHWLRG